MSASRWPILGQMTGGSSGEHHLDFKPVDTSKTEDALRAAETACQLAIQQISQEVEASQELLRYPQGEGDEGDAVTITERDMEELQPGKFLGNNIVDFYIRFLERSLPPEHRKRFYFFNSFFFQKLLQSSAPTRIDPCKVDYEQLRRWTVNVNLFEKDYVFIPILQSSHWSIIIICHLSSLTCALDEMTRFPCMVHLDPIEGQHETFESLLRSYVLQAWMERFQPSIDKDQLLALYQIKYVQAKVPQQVNFYDCGLYVLNYIEAFLIKLTSSNFHFASSDIGVHFTSPHFAMEVWAKRMHIQTLILELIQRSQEHSRKHTTMTNLVQELRQASQNLRFFLHHEGYSQVCIKDVQLPHPTISSSEDCTIIHVSNHKDSMDGQYLQSTLESRGNNESLSGPQIGLGFVECENRSENLSPKQHIELEMQTIGPTNFKGSIFEAKHLATHEESINVQHQQSSKISKLDFVQLDGLELPHAKLQAVNESLSYKLEEMPCMDLLEAQKGTNKRGKNMTHEETLVLLLCKLEGGRFCKGSGGATHWNLISKEIEKKLGSQPSANQCRLRYDTLLKAYKMYKKYCMKTSKTFSTITKEEQLDLKVATTLCEEWYTIISKICEKAKSRKRIKVNPYKCDDLHPLSLHGSLAPTPPPISNGMSFKDGVATLDSAYGTSKVAFHNFFLARVSGSLNEDLQSTLLNLVQECSWTHELLEQYNGRVFYLKTTCRRLAILQDHEPSEILNYVFKLWELKLVNVKNMDFEERKEFVHIDHWNDETWFLRFPVYEEISKEVLCKNPFLKTYYNCFPIEQSSLQYIKVLSLYGCWKLKHLDLRKFPILQCLDIYDCTQFNLVTSWEFATSLGSINIGRCFSYHDFPNLHHLFSLKEFAIDRWGCKKSTIPWQFSQFHQCSKLQRLEILSDKSLSEIADLEGLKDLKFLEFLLLGECTFSSIQGLSGLQALKILHLRWCNSLRRVLDLVCLKGLTELKISCCGIEDVLGVGELHLLTSLDLHGCQLLKRLPFLGHLTALVYLDLRWTSVKEVLGKEKLINLKTLRLDIK